MPIENLKLSLLQGESMNIRPHVRQWQKLGILWANSKHSFNYLQIVSYYFKLLL